MAVALNSDGTEGRRRLAAPPRTDTPTPVTDAEIAVWDTETGRNIARGAIGYRR